ncbi:MAG: hypothetical protein MI975_01355 [Cytophagales bacterium]|nr:hypothetical protein [Cytophagales bacterium]
MKTILLKLRAFGFSLFFIFTMIVNPLTILAQDAEKDTVETVQDNSSSFNDSVQFDDMEPIFYEAAEEEAEPAGKSGSGIFLYVGIAAVLIIVLIVLKKMGKRKS